MSTSWSILEEVGGSGRQWMHWPSKQVVGPGAMQIGPMPDEVTLVQALRELNVLVPAVVVHY